MSRGWGYVAGALLWTLAFFVAPLVLMVAESLRPPVGAAPEFAVRFGAWAQVAASPDLIRSLANSLEVAGLATAISVLLAWPAAWALSELVPERWQRLVLVALVLPFWTSYVVRSYAWVLVLSASGVVNRGLIGLGVIDVPLVLAGTRGATVLGFVHFFVMLMVLTIHASLVQIPKSYARAARDLGASGWQVVWRITLPLSLPGVVTGAFLSFVICVGDYVTPQILGGSNELLAPQVIMMQIGRRADFPTASVIALILMLIVAVAWVASTALVRRDRA